MRTESKERRSLLERLGTIDSRILYVMLMIFIAALYIYPLGIPLPVSRQVTDFHKTLEELAPGSVVLLDSWLAPGLYPQLVGTPALIKYLSEQYPASHNGGKLKLIVVTGQDVGIIGFEEKIKPVFENANLQYGVDYVFLGYLTGMETYVARLAENIPDLVSIDYYGNTLDDFSIMEGVIDYTDIDIVLTLSSGEIVEWYVKHWAQREVKVVSMTAAFYYAKWNTYYLQGSLKGLVGSSRASAEFEYLIGKPGLAVATTDTLSISIFFMIILILIGNSAYIERKIFPKGRGDE